MNLQTLNVPLFAAATVAGGCASSDTPYGSDDYRYGSKRSNEGYCGTIDSTQPARVATMATPSPAPLSAA